jgi:O-antigen ligase
MTPVTRPDPADVRGTTLRDVGSRLLVAAAFTSPWGGFSLGGLQLVDLLIALAVVCFGYEAIAALRWPGAPGWVWLGGVAVAVTMFVHVLFPTAAGYIASRVRLGSLDQLTGETARAGVIVQGLEWLVALVVVPALLIAAGERREKALTWVAMAWGLGAAASAAVAVSDFAGATSVGSQLLGFANTSGRQSGLSSHPNNLGVACALATPVALLILSKRRASGMLLIALLAFGVLLSGSRGAQAVFVIAVTFTLALVQQVRRRTSRILAVLGVAAASVLFVFPQISQELGVLLRFGREAGAAESDRGRSLLAQQALLDAHERPFVGIGLDYITSAHSVYLQLISAGGLLLTVGVLAYLFGAIRAAWRLREDENPLPGYLFITLVAWLAVGSVENQLTDRYLYVPVGCIAALQHLRQRRSVQAGGAELPKLSAPKS